MAIVKTAVSLQKSLFEQIEQVAQEMKVSRSRIFALALEKFLREYEDRQLFDQINKAYEEEPFDADEELLMQHINRQHRRILEDEW